MSGRVVWEWQHSDGHWVEYSGMWSKQLQEAAAQGQAEHVINHKGHVYRITFKTMLQTNELTGKQRAVRVRQEGASKEPNGRSRSRSPKPEGTQPTSTVSRDPGPANLWQWLDEQRGWTSYDAPTLAAIRKAYAEGRPSVEFLKAGTVVGLQRPEDAFYELNFRYMYQQNKGTGSRRPVRTIRPESVSRAPTHRWRWEGADGRLYTFPGAISDWLQMLFEMRDGKGIYQFNMPQFGDETLYISFPEMRMYTAGGLVHRVVREPLEAPAGPDGRRPPPTDVVWQVADGANGWLDLPPPDSALIEDAFRSGTRILTMANGKYQLDLRRRVRTNLENGGTRTLNRVAPPPLPTCTQRPTVAEEPQGEASWPEKTEMEAADLAAYDAIVKQQGAGTLYNDAAFPPTDASFYGPTGPSKGMRAHLWKRFDAISATGKMPWTFNRGRYDPNDIVQGHLGSCWFVSMLSVIAERPYLMQRLLPRPGLQSSGAYVVCFYVHGRLTPVIVDDHFPVLTPPFTAIWGTRGRNNQLWVPIMEKAYAKLHGSYAALSGGVPGDALSDLTGAPCQTIEIPFQRNRVPKDLWEKLQKWHRRGHLFGTSCGRDSHEVNSHTFQEMGLVEGHAYSVLDFAEVAAGGAAHRLVRLRNPYGYHEWTGDWSDSSPMWTPELRALLRVQEEGDGLFWMPYHDFLTYFFQVVVCFVGQRPSYAHTALHLHPTAKQSPLSCAMLEFKIPASDPPIAVSVELRQTGKRGKDPAYQLNDLSGIVVRCDGQHGAGSPVVGTALLDGLRDVGLVMNRPLPSGIYRVLICSLLGGSKALDSHPRSCALRLTSTLPILVRQPPMCMASLRLGLHLLLDHGRELEWKPFKLLEKTTVMPGVRVVEYRSYCGRCVAVFNASGMPVLAQYDSSGTAGAQLSRPKYRTADVVPSHTRQIVLFAGCGPSSLWVASHLITATTEKERHEPSVVGTVHEPMPL